MQEKSGFIKLDIKNVHALLHTVGSALSTEISQTFPSWPAPNSDSKSRVAFVAFVAFGAASTLSGIEFSIILDCKVDLWLGLRT